jgi:cytochrome c oxidase assembly factor 6
VKYFKEKRVMEYNRDKTIERIKKEDADKMKELKTQGWKST